MAGSTWTFHVRQSYCDLCGYTDRGVWVEYVYVPRTARVTVTYVDTLTEGYRWSGRPYVYVLSELL